MKTKYFLRVFSLVVLLLSLIPVSNASALPLAETPPTDMFQLPWDLGIAWVAIDGIDNGTRRPLSSSHNYSVGGAIDFAPHNNMRLGENTSNFWVTAAASGTVIAKSFCHVKIDHGNGWTTEYQFLANVQVKTGDSVFRNQRIGIIADGIRQRFCPGSSEPNVPHLHFMLRPTLRNATLAGWEVNYLPVLSKTTFRKNDQTLGLFKPLLNTFDQVQIVMRGPITWDTLYTGSVDPYRYERWSLTLEELNKFTLTATPTASGLVPLIVLLDGNGNEIARNAGTLTSTQPPGSYFVQIQPQSGSGSYSLLLQKNDLPTGPYVSTVVSPGSVGVGQNTTATVRLNNVPSEGYTSAEFTCTYDASVASVSNIVVADLFGADPAVATNDPQNGSFIVAIAGSNGSKATTSGTVFTFSVAGKQAGQTAVECKARVSKGDNTLTGIDFISGSLTVTGNILTPTPVPPTVPVESPVPTFTPSPTPPTGTTPSFTPSPTPTVTVSGTANSPTPSNTPGGPTSTPDPSAVYDFAVNACEATWFSGAGQLPCPGTEGDPKGFVLKLSNPLLETGNTDSRPGLLTFPQNVQNGYIQGVYPPFHVQDGDRFRATIGCEGGATSCYVAFRLDYQVGSEPIRTFWGPFLERYDGHFYNIDISLSPLAGKDVKFVLSVLSAGVATGDRALWVGPIISRAGDIASPTPSATPTDSLTPVISPTPTIPAGWLTFNNATYNFRFLYPQDAQIVAGGTDNSTRINLPYVPGTNLSEKYLHMSVAENVTTCRSPLASSSIPQTSETAEINGISFLKETGEDGTAGHINKWTAYSTMRNNICVSLDFVLRAANPGVFTTPPPLYDEAAESLVFGQIVSTFQWLGGTATPSLTPDGSVTPTSTPSPSPSPTATALTDGTVTGQVLASKPVTVGLYDAGNVLVTSVTANTDGTFSLTAPGGTYTIRASASGFLDAEGSVTIPAGGTTTKPSLSLQSGDIDGNGVVNQFDALTIGMSYNTATPPEADLNNDGVINVLDLELLANSYRKSAPQAWN